MYLSRLQLNTNNSQVWRSIIANPYKVHQMVMRGFPDDSKRDKADVLHRLDIQEWGATLLVQSALEPDWSQINPEYLLPPDPFSGLENPAVKALNLPLRAGQILSFRLCANPTIKKVRRDEDGKRHNSNRVPLVHEEKQMEWLYQRAEAAGFRVLQAGISRAQKETAWKKGGGKPITFYVVQFDGRLQVEQPDTMLQAVETGIGPSRAFGCGLLSLGPA